MTVNTLGSDEQDRSSRTVAEWLWPFLPMGISAFSLSALIWYHLRRDVFERDIHSALQLLYANLYKLIGFAPSVLFFLLTLTWSSIWFATGKVDRPLGRLGRLLAMTVMIGILINLGHGGVAPEVHKGELGAWLAEHLVGTFGYLASLLVVWAVTFASMLLATDFFFSDSFERLRVGRGAEAAAEAGVETAVTDHLRGLGAPSTPVAAPTLPVDVARQSPLAGAAAVVAAAAVTTAPLPLAIEEPIAEAPPEPRRRSYAERRRDRERRWEQEEWVPPAPENQEIENPEASLRSAEANAFAALQAAPGESAASIDTEAVAAPTASAAAAAGVDESTAVDGETEADSDLVDIDELGDIIGDDAEVTELDEELDDEHDEEHDDEDDVDGEGVETERDQDGERAAPVEVERPVVIAFSAAAPVAEVAGNPIDADADADDADFADEDVEDEVVAAAEDDDVEDDDAEDDDVEADDTEDDDETDLAEIDVTAETAASENARTVMPIRRSIDDEPVVAIPRPEPTGVWSQVTWRRPQPPVAPPPVEIPTPTPTPTPTPASEPVAGSESTMPRELAAHDGAEERVAVRQQQLFGSWLDEGLVQDAIDVVTSTRRANAALLQRKLRIDYALAMDVLGALAARGVVELEGDSTQGRVLV